MNGATLIGGGAVSPNPGQHWKAIGAGDFNHDGHSDIVWQNRTRQVAIWEMNGNNLIGGGTVSTNPGSSWHAIGTGGEGSSNLLFQNTNGTNIIGGGAVSTNAGSSWKAIGLSRLDSMQPAAYRSRESAQQLRQRRPALYPIKLRFQGAPRSVT